MPDSESKEITMVVGVNELRKSLTTFIKVPPNLYKLPLSNTAMRVLLHLIYCADSYHPSYNMIGHAIGGIGVREVQRAIKYMVEMGLIRQTQVGCKLTGTTNKYDVSNLKENIEKYLEKRPGMKSKSKGRCLVTEPESEDSVNPDALALENNITQGVA